MTVFAYQAINKSGMTSSGQVNAENEMQVMEMLRAKGFYMTKLRKVRESGSSGSASTASSGAGAGSSNESAIGSSFISPAVKQFIETLPFFRVPPKLVVEFSQELATLHDAGLPIFRSLKIMHQQQKPGKFKDIIGAVATDVEGGSSLSEAMSAHPTAFDRLYVKMIEAGELGGVLDVIFHRLAENLEKSLVMKKRLLGALVYPAVVLSVAVLIVTGIMVFIIPKFVKIFVDFGVELPWLTKMLLDVSGWISATGEYSEMLLPGWVYIPFVPILIYLGLKLIRINEGGRRLIDRILLYIPIAGKLVRYASIGRFTRTLGTLIAAGVKVTEAISIARDTVGNAIYEDVLNKTHEAVVEGDSISSSLRESSFIEPMVSNMVEVGEETGDLDTVLIKVANRYDEAVDNAVKSMMSLLEPVMIVVLGSIVLLIVSALFLPMTQLMSSVGGG